MITRWYFGENYVVIVFGILTPHVILFCGEVSSVFNRSKPQLSGNQITNISNGWLIYGTEENDSPRSQFQDHKGPGCQRPIIEPFNEEMRHLDGNKHSLVCNSKNWVGCQLSQCKVKLVIHEIYDRIKCVYQDLIYDNDEKSHFGPEVTTAGDEVYTLVNSDHAKVNCIGQKRNDPGSLPTIWSGYVMGFRKTQMKNTLRAHSNTFNVLIFGFDSVSRSGFVRNMPLSHKVLVKNLHAVILNGYNNVGDGTRKALYPILTGKDEKELPNVKTGPTKVPMDRLPWIFYNLKEYGYRTAYFEDSPATGSLKRRRLNGWMKQPTDHYARHFFLKVNELKNRDSYCFGDVPYYAMMMKMTKDFFKLGGNKFCFTFIVNITHNVDNKIQLVDEYLATFLKKLKSNGQLNDTLFILMSGHGPRFQRKRNTFKNELKEKQPFMAIMLPEKLKTKQPGAYMNLIGNENVLTTPHDIYATILDVLDMRESWNLYKVRGANMTRGLSLIKRIPANRSCSEAGVEQDWCTCFNWREISRLDLMFNRAANVLLQHINNMVANHEICMLRYLISVDYVLKQQLYNPLPTLQEKSMGPTKAEANNEYYVVRITIGPGEGVYEATLTYFRKENTIAINTRDILRANAFHDGKETACVQNLYPHLNLICYCRDYFKRAEGKKMRNMLYFRYYSTTETSKTWKGIDLLEPSKA